MRLLTLALLLGFSLIACSAHAQPPRTYQWFDGDDTYQAFIDPKWVGVIQTPGTSATDNDTKPGVQIVRLVEVTQKAQQAALARGEMPKGIAKGADEKLTPVFTTTPTGGRRMALPGNVIVWLDLSFNADQCKSWLAEQKLPVIAAVDGGRNAYIIEAPAGLPGLELANALRTRKGIRAASPNWWKEAQLR